LLQQLLHRAVTDNGNAVARVSLQAVLLRWLQKALAQGNDPHTASVLASAAYNLDVIHNLTSNGSGSGTSASGPSTALVPARKQADQGNAVSKKTLTIVAVIAAILGVAVIVLAALMLTRGKKGSSPSSSSFSPDTPSASAGGGGGGGGLGGRYGQVYRPSGREAFGPSSPPLQAHSTFHQPTFAPL
jgi:hypothetical protein